MKISLTEHSFTDRSALYRIPLWQNEIKKAKSKNENRKTKNENRKTKGKIQKSTNKFIDKIEKRKSKNENENRNFFQSRRTSRFLLPEGRIPLELVKNRKLHNEKVCFRTF